MQLPIISSDFTVHTDMCCQVTPDKPHHEHLACNTVKLLSTKHLFAARPSKQPFVTAGSQRVQITSGVTEWTTNKRRGALLHPDEISPPVSFHPASEAVSSCHWRAIHRPHEWPAANAVQTFYWYANYSPYPHSPTPRVSRDACTANQQSSLI